MSVYLLDTNVFLRLLHAEDSEHTLTVRAISSLTAAGHRLCLTSQVFIEFWSVATRPAEANGLGWPVELVEREIRRAFELFPVLDDTSAVFDKWFALVVDQELKGKRVHDARLVAVMLAHGATHLLTFNVDDFRPMAGIAVVHPRDAVAIA